jgi:hypothetical protein
MIYRVHGVRRMDTLRATRLPARPARRYDDCIATLIDNDMPAIPAPSSAHAARAGHHALASMPWSAR